ncbi:hypothetical protein QQ054_38795 [Oscillatoria amoena NRMC-F 0135]|nr:hypothetical protein [Oscillatoria amoena NRMC-F 0135]
MVEKKPIIVSKFSTRLYLFWFLPLAILWLIIDLTTQMIGNGNLSFSAAIFILILIVIFLILLSLAILFSKKIEVYNDYILYKGLFGYKRRIQRTDITHYEQTSFINRIGENVLNVKIYYSDKSISIGNKQYSNYSELRETLTKKNLKQIRKQISENRRTKPKRCFNRITSFYDRQLGLVWV